MLLAAFKTPFKKYTSVWEVGEVGEADFKCFCWSQEQARVTTTAWQVSRAWGHHSNACQAHLCCRLVLRFSGAQGTDTALLCRWMALKAGHQHPRKIFRKLKNGAFGPNRMDTWQRI